MLGPWTRCPSWTGTARPSPPTPVVHEVARRYAGRLARTDHVLLGRLLGTDPPSGFALDEAVRDGEVALVGRHRFSQYRLVFAIADQAGGPGSTLSVLSYAAFPGVQGRAYRALLLGTGGHVLAVRQMLRAIRAEAERDQPGAAS